MLSKVKIIIISILIIGGLFGIYSKEYLSQAIPVYIQYLEQRHKWEQINTGTYVYFHNRALVSHYFFIKENELQETLRYGSSYKKEDIKDKKYFYSAGDSFRQRFINTKSYLIDAQFDEIKKILWDKLWNSTKEYNLDIIYDKKYGYPIRISENYLGNKIIFGFVNDNLKLSLHLQMFSEDIEYNDKLLMKLLDEYKQYSQKPFSDGKMIEEVGGDIVRGFILE